MIDKLVFLPQFFLEISTLSELQEWLNTLGSFSGAIALISIAYFINRRFEILRREQEKANREEDALSKYFENMSDLVVNKGLTEAQHDEPVARAAQVLTVSVMIRLNQDRLSEIRNFLVRSALSESGKSGPAILKGSDFANVDFSNYNLAQLDLRDTVFRNSILIETELKKSDLEGATLEAALLKSSNLTKTNLKGANLEGANLEKANLQGADLKKANLREANLRETNLRRASLQGVTYEFWKFVGLTALLMNSGIGGARKNINVFDSLKIIGVNLEDADLEKADLEEANLEGAKLKGAKLKGANLKGTSLRRANLEETNLAGVNLEKAGYSSQTRFPKSFDLNNSGMIEINALGDPIKSSK